MAAQDEDASSAVIAASARNAWTEVLDIVARCAGGWGAHYFVTSREHVLLASVGSGAASRYCAAFETAGGADPARNPLLAAAAALPPLSFVQAPDLRARLGDRFVAGVLAPHDALVSWAGRVSVDPGDTAVLTVLRSRAEEPADAARRAAFGRILETFQAVVADQAAEHRRCIDTLASVFERLGRLAFFCAADGRLLGRTETAAALLESRDLFETGAGRLRPVLPGDRRQCEAVMRRIGRPGGAAADHGHLLLRTRSSGEPRLFRVVALPPMSEIALGRPLLVTAPGESASLEVRTLTDMGLTAAEAAVAVAAGAGLPTAAIAGKRGVSANTVKTQLKAAYAKLAIKSRAALARLIRDMSA